MLPSDFDQQLWFAPLTWQGILGRSFAHNVEYRLLFRDDGFARPKAELLADPRVAKAMPDKDEIERDALFTSRLAKQENSDGR